MKYKIN